MVPTIAADAKLSPGAPDWRLVQKDPCCPLCSYNLRGLIDPQCPECGYRFVWPEILTASETRHPYLYEHHPERNVRSFLRTIIAGTMPRRFWRTLTARHAIDLARQQSYYVATVCVPLVVALPAVVLWATFTVFLTSSGRFASSRLPRSWTIVAQVVDVIHIGPFWPRFGMVATAILWPWITFASLMIFRGSMRRAAVTAGHVCRCVVYCFDFTVLVAIVAMIWPPDIPYFDWNEFALNVVGTSLIIVPVGFYRMGSACRNYLRISHPYLTALASPLVTLLLIAMWALKVKT